MFQQGMKNFHPYIIGGQPKPTPRPSRGEPQKPGESGRNPDSGMCELFWLNYWGMYIIGLCGPCQSGYPHGTGRPYTREVPCG